MIRTNLYTNLAETGNFRERAADNNRGKNMTDVGRKRMYIPEPSDSIAAMIAFTAASTVPLITHAQCQATRSQQHHIIRL